MSPYTAVTVSTEFVEANGIPSLIGAGASEVVCPLSFKPALHRKSRQLGSCGSGRPAKEREVIIFNNAGVASSTGEVPTTFQDGEECGSVHRWSRG